MDQPQRNPVNNFESSNSEILRKRLLNSSLPPVVCLPTQINGQHINTRTTFPKSMLMPVTPSPNSIPINHSGFNQQLKVQQNTQSYPLQLHIGSTQGISTVNVPVQIPGPSSNMPLPGSTSQFLNTSIQCGNAQQVATTNVPVQLPAGATINVPLQLPNAGHNIHLGSQGNSIQLGNPSLPLLQNSVTQPNFNNPIYVQVGSNSSQITTLSNAESSQPSTSVASTSACNSRKNVPQLVYIQTPSGLKTVNSSEILSTASTSGNPPQIVVRRPSNTGGVYISNVNTKTIPSRAHIVAKSSLISGSNPTQIVIQKPKSNTLVPVTLSANATKSGYAYCVKKTSTPKSENQSILISSSQPNTSTQSNQKVYFTPMNAPKLILPVGQNPSMVSKGPIINLQIANGQIQSDTQGGITVMRDSITKPSDGTSNQKLCNENKGKAFTSSIPGSRVEQTGEQEYTLSIPETNSMMNDDIYTVSITDDNNDSKSFTLSIPDKSKNIINNRPDSCNPAPAILRRSNSENIDKKNGSANLKRRISLCNDKMLNKTTKNSEVTAKESESDDHKVPSLFCDEKLDKDLEGKVGDQGTDDEKTDIKKRKISMSYDHPYDNEPAKESVKLESSGDDSPVLEWYDGVGQIKGSSLQFQTNEFGLIDTRESDEENNAKFFTPIKEKPEKKTSFDPDELYCCINCGCHGLCVEFITSEFCSSSCQTEYQRMNTTKKYRARGDLTKKRNKLKKVIMRQQKEEDVFQYKEDEDERAKQYDFTSNENSSSMFDQCMPKEEEISEDTKYPWMCGKNGFSWMKYLEFCKAQEAPVHLFKNAFPAFKSYKNGFKIGMKLEAIDPNHTSIFAVVTVVEVQGYRLRLHFDGYPDSFDFWVNADSPDIFPQGYREKHGKTLWPPKGMDGETFSWTLYLKQCRAVAAPKHLFPHLSSSITRPNCFRIGMKLEAEDRKNGSVCVASIVDIMDNRLLINFDSWDDIYDYWVEPNSPYIHPIHWADENGRELTLPDFYKNPEEFTWKRYLSETGATAVPARAFKPRPPQPFAIGMKLEVVDKRVPFLIRVATITDIKDYRLRISFDGWPDELSYWLDDDSPDIHPVGWCLKTGHPLEPPLTAEELEIFGPCGTPGCTGLGSLLGGKNKSHTTRSACPYSGGRSPAPKDRLPATIPPARTCPPHKPPSKIVPTRGRPPKAQSTTSNTEEKTSNRGRPSKNPSGDSASKCSDQNYKDDINDWLSASQPCSWERLEDLVESDPSEWECKRVAETAAQLVGPQAARLLYKNGVRGMELLAVSKSDLQSIGLKLGPVVKLYAAILKLRKIALAHYRRRL